jgi:spore maturation protein CgeB
MRVLLVGSFLGGALEFTYERDLKRLGCEVRRFDMAQVNRFLIPYWEMVINKRIDNLLNNFRPDLILVMKGTYLWPKTIKKIKELSKGSLIFCFNGDDPFNLSSPGASNRNILDSIPYYDCYLIWTRSLTEPLVKVGAKKVEWLPFGFDPQIHYPTNPSLREQKNFGSDIVFVGNWDAQREKWLKELVDFDLGLWGENYWRRRCQDKTLRNRWRAKALYGKEMSLALNASKVSLNILRIQNKGNHNMRTFEVPACGAFALAERSEEAKEFFAEDKETVYFSTPEELKDKIHYYLNHEQERKRIAQAGYQRCLKSNYSYLYRAKRIVEVYEAIRKNM